MKRVSDTGGKRRIAHVMFSLEPGGLENGVVNLSNGLDPDRFESRIYCLERGGGFVSRLQSRVEVFILGKKSGFSRATVCRLIGRIRADRPDVLHTHNLGPLIYGVLAVFCAGLRIPILHGEHGVFRESEQTLRILMMRRVLYRFCRRIHTVSESLLEFLVGLGLPRWKITAVLNGVDCERFHPAVSMASAKQELDLPEQAEVIGMVGRLVPSKRHLMMLEAFESIAVRRPSSLLLLVGDGGSEREAVLAAIQEHPYRDRVRWVGHQDDTVSFYQAMDLLVMPSSVEGLSNALLEAMACGVPCLAHPACGASEVIEKGSNGELYDMADSGGIASGVIAVLADSDVREEMGVKARQTAVERFSLSQMVTSYSTLYEELCSKTGRSRKSL